METAKLILQGGGEHARVVLDCLLDNGQQVLALFDPKYRGELMTIPQRGEYDERFEPEAKAIVAIGDNAVRKRVVTQTRHTFAKAIHKSAIISKSSSIGEGSMLLHGCIVQAQSSIGKHVILNTGVQVDHDCLIGDYVHLAPRVVLCGAVKVQEGAFIGAGAIILPGRSIGCWAIVGAGAVVTKDIPDYAVAVGNPARIIKFVDVHE